MDAAHVRIDDYAPYEQMAVHRHDYASVSVVLRGEIGERSQGRTVTGRACSVFVKPAGVPHENQFGARGARTLSLRLDSGWSGRLGATAAYGVLRETEVAGLLLRAGACDDDPARLKALTRECFAALARRLPDAVPADDWLETARRQLEDGGSCCAEVAASAGVCAASLSRAVRRRFGATPGDIRRRGRVLRAAERLGDGVASLADIAARAGFADQSHMTRDFRRELGLTPGQLRARAVAG